MCSIVFIILYSSCILNTNARLVVLHVTVYNTERSSFAWTLKKILGG